jgi:RNA polymerase sigma-70 factor (ECF subfamily)
VDDLTLVRLCLAGDDAAWRELASLHGAGLYRTISRTLARAGRAGAEETEEVYQATLVALVDDGGRRLKTFRGECSLRAWLVAVAARAALDHLRRLKVRHTVPLTDVAAERDPSEELPHAGTEEIQAGLAKLDPLDATVLRLYHYEGLPYAAISRMVGIPINTLCPRITRARERLRKLLAEKMH